MDEEHFLMKNVVASIDEKSKGTILRSMAIFAAIELCGSFLTGKTGRGTTKSNFLEFCKSKKYMPTEYKTRAELLYSIFRNGVAHSYIPKGAAILSSDKDAENMHLEYCSDGLFIYVPQLANDVTRAIQDFYKDLKCTKDLQDKHAAVISKLDKDGKEAYNRHISDNRIKPKPCKIKGDIATTIL
jgi:hypothetical protein